MMQEKQVRLGVDDSKLKEVGGTTKKIYDDMIRSARSYTTSSKEVLRDLEEQIRLMEKRNKLEKDLAIQRAAPLKEYGGAKEQEKYAAIVGDATGRFREGKLQVQLLRELIDTVKASAKDEIKSNRETVEKIVRKDKGLDRLGVSGDPEEALKRTIQREMLGDLGEEEQVEKAKFKAFGKFGKGAGRAFNTAAQLGTSKNELYALAGLVGLTPVIGQGLSAIANRLLSAGETAERSMTGYGLVKMGSTYSSTKTEWDRVRSTGLGIDLGMDPSTLLTRRAELMRTTGRGISDSGFMGVMGAEKYLGAGSINQMAEVNRYGSGNLNQVIRALEGNQRNITRLTENVNTYVQASNTHLNISSSIDEVRIAKTIMGISTATGQKGIGLNQVTGAIQGLGNNNDPTTRSLMIRAFRQSNPNASLFEIQAMMEDPLANFNKGGSQFFANLKRMSGGGDMYKQVLYSTFQGQLSKTRINEILASGGDFTNIAKEIQASKEGNFDFLKGAKSVTGIGATYTAKADAFFQDWGQKTLQFSADTVEKLKSMYDKFVNFGDDWSTEMEAQAQERREHNKKVLEAVNNATTNMEKANVLMKNAVDEMAKQGWSQGVRQY